MTRDIVRIELTPEQRRALWSLTWALDDIASKGPPGATMGQLVRMGDEFVAVRLTVLSHDEAKAVQAVLGTSED